MARKKLKKPGRPPVNPRSLSERYQVRVAAEHRELFEALAEADGRSLSAWSYRKICEAVGLVPPPGAP